MKNSILILMLSSIFYSCSNAKYDGLILTDENTGKKYLIKQVDVIVNTYKISEQVKVIVGNDTTLMFK